MTSRELREKYLRFFESKGHLIHSSDSLVPDDPTLLYTSAGMVQFKPYYTGERVPPSTRIVTSQKCMRTDDIEEVGDAVHHTFFEMLGNFSFGDYFKRESIIWAWEFLTKVLELNPDHIWTSLYTDDDEAADVWIKEVGFPAERLVRLGEDKNYWPANAPSKGPNGVCGPCNEIFLDTSPQLGRPENPTWSIAHDGARFVEIWNLVFTQFERKDGGELVPLPSKNIDTGMGLERTVAILNRVATDYETDLFLPIVKRIESLSGARYGADEKADLAIRVIADHARSAVFAIADGVMPSNVGRGYVLRRIIRNAVIKGRKIGLSKPFLAAMAPTVVEIMGDIYHEVADRQVYIEKLISSEEEKFRRTLESGLDRLESLVESAANSQEKKIDGDSAFSLYDTYGFPLELTCEIAAESGVAVDTDGFKTAMDEQRKRAKEASDFGSVMAAGGGSVLYELEKSIEPTVFVGYDDLLATATVLALVKGDELVSTAHEGEMVDCILDRTPFYAETGGQVGDTGVIECAGGRLEVSDTRKASGFFVHKAKVESGSISVGDEARTTVDRERRMAIARNHTATHLLHAALHTVLGEHALQAGSVVEPTRLRFDFSHFQAVTPQELREIETMVNRMILEDLPAGTVVASLDEARAMGATALFGEKYGNQVRVVRMGDKSLELCGGTHLTHTSQVGMCKLVSESSIGAGLRRVEGVTGEAALEYVHGLENKLDAIASALGSSVTDAISSAERAVQSAKDSQKEIDRLKSKDAAAGAESLVDQAQVFGDVRLVAAKVDSTDVDVLQKLADSAIQKLKSGIVILAGVGDGKVMFVGKVTSDLTGRGFHAGNILREVAKVAGGGGGGKPEFAQAGGKDPSKVDDAIAKAAEIVEAVAGG